MAYCASGRPVSLRAWGHLVNTEQARNAVLAPLSLVSETSARKLIDKLAISGQLRASYLIRVLREGQIELFDHGFAMLLQLDVEPMRQALYGQSPRSVALAGTRPGPASPRMRAAARRQLAASPVCS